MKPRSTRRSRYPVVAFLTCMLLLPCEVKSQEQAQAAPIALGTRVRILAPTVVGKRIEGMVVEIDEKSLLVGMDDRAPLRVPRQAITQLEVSMGKHRRVLKGAIIGAGIGAAMMVLGASTLGQLDGSSSDSTGEVAYGLAVGLGGGAIWGAAIGAMVKRDRWSRIPPERVRVNLAPTRGRGVQLSLSLAF